MITDRELRLLRLVRVLACDLAKLANHGGTCDSAGGVDLCNGHGIAGQAVSQVLDRRLGSGRIHKAGSAEAILRHCLRRLGFRKRYNAGELSGAEHLELLAAVTQYGRDWLRHEAEQFAAHYMESPVTRAIGSAFAGQLGRFFGRVKQFVREHIVAGAMALLGPAPLTGEELEAAERNAQKQEQFFDRFHEAMKQTPPPSPDQFAARTESYGNAAWQAAQVMSRMAAQKIFRFERRVLGNPKTEHCNDCPPIAAMGWQPIGTLPLIGETECNGACLCSFRFKETEDGHEFFRGKKGPVPAPPIDIEILPETGEDAPIAWPP